ncbi:LLM class flavin-dependent oxidoreductase [Novosphingobium flavum]|uniref:LLM class flavin-dependent oxidoreductase n=1 Tax=Novosphingobium flavum TaxID=1778672 RepID=A0A7X1KK54_9SPHN|nr:LLM class flavin-dependent oxidoreductase [Novosphingobium flavum]MBC2664184.1 LLM class flavin-dependent oxidoreductase [Novosphingobium flavum]
MTISAYWELDPAAEPQRFEPLAGRQLPGIVKSQRGPALNRFDYYAQVGSAAAQAGFSGLFIRHREEADESRVIAAAVAREVPGIVLVPEFPASVGSAVYAAKQAVSFQRSTRNRLGWAIAAAEGAADRRRSGDYIGADDLGERLEEFLTVARGVHAAQPFTFEGRHFAVKDGGFADPLNRADFPQVFLQGEDEEDLEYSARQADVHLFRASALADVSRQVETLDGLGKRTGRPVAYGLLQPVVARPFADEAQRHAERIGAPAEALVGSYDEVAARLADLAGVGISHFVFRSLPSLEEAYLVGQHVLPRLRARLSTLRVAA